MEGDLDAAELRDTQMKNAARRRAHWPKRAGWRISAKGNPTIRVDNYRITVFPHRDGWRAVVKDLWSGRDVWARRTYPSIKAAQLAAFDRMVLGI